MSLRKILAIFAILLIAVIVFSFGQKYLRDLPLPFTQTATATINNQRFNLTVAKSDQEKEIGLSERQSLPQDSGMLFVFEELNYYSFWMKNMRLPVDIIFIRGDQIVTIYENVQPPKEETTSLPIYKPKEPADKVLEINAGLSRKHNFKEGNKVTFENL